MADVACYLLNLSNVLGIDLSEAIVAKIAKNAVKYPAEQYRGRWTQVTSLDAEACGVPPAEARTANGGLSPATRQN